jgi:hypothetical protein
MATFLSFAGLGTPIVVELPGDASDSGIEEACDLLLPGWRRRPAAPDAVADIIVERTGEGFAATARSCQGGVACVGDVNNLANAIGGMLTDALLARHAALCCLHAATVIFGGAAILCVGATGAGKSTLALRFATRGYRIFGDDRVVVDTRRSEAFALGLTAKARLPLPPGEVLAAFVAQRTVMSEGDVSYLHLAPTEQAPFGEKARIAAIVLVERDPAMTGPDEVGRLRAGPLAAGLIGEATAPGAASSVVAAVTRLARSVDGRRLRFADGERAVEALLRDLALDTNALLT